VKFERRDAEQPRRHCGAPTQLRQQLTRDGEQRAIGSSASSTVRLACAW
jgi:hypothetical protein